MSGPVRLSPRPPLLHLGPAIASAGYATDDHAAIIASLEALVPDAPSPAVAKRRAEFMAGRWAARQALAELGIEAIPARGEGGLPVWPREATGSITHGAERALSVAARASEIRSLGIDAERLMKTAKPELSRRIGEATELAELERSLRRPHEHALTLAFSAKESLYKCLHPLVGRFMDFHAARVVQAEVSEKLGSLHGELTLELAVPWSAELRQGRRFQARFVMSADHVETGVLLQA